MAPYRITQHTNNWWVWADSNCRPHPYQGWPANLYRFEGQDVCLSIEAGCDYSCDGILSEKGGTQSILVSGSYRDHIRKVEGTQVSCPR